MSHIPPLGWAAIAFVVILILLMNFILFAFLRNPPRPGQMKMPRSQKTVEDLQKMTAVLRDPFKDDRSQLGELVRRVEPFKAPPDQPEGKRQG